MSRTISQSSSQLRRPWPTDLLNEDLNISKWVFRSALPTMAPDSRKRSYDLFGRVTRNVIKPRDPCTNSHGFTQAELLEKSVKVIVCFEIEREKFSLNLLCITVIRRLCHNISRPQRWVEQPRRTVPPLLRFIHTAASTSQVRWVFGCRYMSPLRVRATLDLFNPVSHELAVLPVIVSQFRATVLSSHHCISSVILNPSSAARTFVDKLTAMGPNTSSQREIVRLFQVRRDLAAIRPCVTPGTCATTGCTTAHTPWLLASPNAGSLMLSFGS